MNIWIIYPHEISLTYKPNWYKMQNMQIIKRLETYRLEKRVSLQKLAEDLGVSFSTVSRWFSGKTKPRKIQQYHIEKFLKKRGL